MKTTILISVITTLVTMGLVALIGFGVARHHHGGMHSRMAFHGGGPQMHGSMGHHRGGHNPHGMHQHEGHIEAGVHAQIHDMLVKGLVEDRQALEAQLSEAEKGQLNELRATLANDTEEGETLPLHHLMEEDYPNELAALEAMAANHSAAMDAALEKALTLVKEGLPKEGRRAARMLKQHKTFFAVGFLMLPVE